MEYTLYKHKYLILGGGLLIIPFESISLWKIFLGFSLYSNT